MHTATVTDEQTDLPPNRQPQPNRQRANESMSTKQRTRSLGLSAAYTYNTGYRKHYKHQAGSPHPCLFSNNFIGNSRLCELTVSLTTADTASGGPGEVSDGDDEEAVTGIGDTSKGIVPGGESSQETEETTGLLDVGVGVAVGTALQVGNTEQEESQVQGEEQHEEGDGGLQSAEQHDGGEDEPALL